METENIKKIIEAILFAAGRVVTIEELMLTFEISKDDLDKIISEMQQEYEQRGIELIKVENGYQLCSKKEYHEYIYPILDKRTKPRLSGASLEVLAIIAYNPRITRPEIEVIRGVSSDASIYKLLEYGLIEEAGKIDAPGRPMSYRTTREFLKMFGYDSLKNLPELPKYKMNENKQIVIDELLEEQENNQSEQNLESEEETKSIENQEEN